MTDQSFLDATMAHLDAVWSISRRMAADHGGAEDLVQETYARAWAGFASKGGGDVRSWLVAICLNTARSELRRDRRRPDVVTDIDGIADAAGTQDVSADALGALERQAIARALAELAEPTRRAIVLVDIGGLSADRIRMGVEASPQPPRPSWRRRGRAAMAATTVALLAVGATALLVVTLGRGATDPAPVAAVVAAAHDPSPPATVVGGDYTLTLVRDSLDGRPVTLAVSDGPFPMAPASRLLGEGPGSPWAAQRGSMTVVCLTGRQNLLVVAELPAERILSWALQLPLIDTGSR